MTSISCWGCAWARTTTSSNPSIPPRSWRACGPCCGARGHANAAPIRVGGIEIDEQDHVAVAHVGGGRSVPLQLTLTEFRLLACLASQPRRCFSRGFLIEHCLPESDALERVIDSHISKLRRKLHAVGQADMIEAVRGVGYRLWRENQTASGSASAWRSRSP